MPLRRAAAAALLAGLFATLSSAPCRGGEPKARAEDSSLYTETDRDAEKLLEAARAAARAGQWRQAVEAYQRVVEFAGKAGAQPLVPAPADPSVLVPIQDAAALELARLPAPALDLYREAHDASAQALFARAVAAKDDSLLAAAARRYLASSWGDDALAALGSIAFEHGDCVGALAAWERLLAAHPKPSVSLASIRARIWACRRALGHARAADALAQELRADHPADSFPIAGKATSVADFLKQPVPVPSLQPLDDWPALGGDAAHARVARGIEEVGGLVWRFLLPDARRDESAAVRRGPAAFSALQVAAAGSGLFAANHAAVYALDAETGRPVWLYPDAPEPSPAPALDETIHAVAFSGGRLFARLAQSVVAFDAASGRLLWRQSFARQEPRKVEEEAEPADRENADKDNKEEGKEPEEGKEKPKPKKKGKDTKFLGSKVTILLTPPVVSGSRVYVGLTDLGEEARAHVLALDAATGQELWRTFLCSRSIPAFLGLGATASPPAVSGDSVYFATNLGTVAALDAATGALRWLQRYASFPNPLRQAAVERGQRWANSPPVLDAGTLFVTPQDGARLLAIDAVSGSLAWSAPRDGGRYLVGVDGGRLLLAGERVQALDELTGKRLWSAVLPEEPMGRPAACPGRLFVPTASGLLAVRTNDGAVATARLWQGDEGPGNVTLADGALFVASADRVHAFADWAAARERLAARLEKDPGDPTVPLALGIHEASRGAHAAAIGHFDEALRLALAKKDAEAARRIRQRLFDSYRALASVGDADALPKALACALSPEEKVSTLLAIARHGEKGGRIAEAIAACQAIIEQQGAARYRMQGGLTVSARALGTAETARLIRQHGRASYAAIEAAASKALAAAKAPAEVEAVVSRYPNSAAAEDALLRLLSAPDALALAAHLGDLAASLAAEPASEARTAVEAKLKSLRAAAGAGRPPLARRWQVQTRVAHRRVDLINVPGSPPGLGYFATARRTFSHALPFDTIECRRLDTGQLLWQRELGEWDGEALIAGGSLVVTNFDRLLALDATSGVERWTCSLAEGEKPGPAAPAPPGPGLDRPEADPDRGEPLLERRRSEKRRVVALAATEQTLCAGLAGGQVFAFSLADGKTLWNRQLDTRLLLSHGLFALGERFWVCTESPGAVHALGARDGAGEPVFTFRRDAGAIRFPRITDRPAWVPGQGRLYVVVDDREVHALDLRQGKDLWQAQVDFSISRVLASEDGAFCYVLPDSYVHNGQVVSLDPQDGKVRRRRSVLTASLADAALGPNVLYLAEKDTDRDLVIQAIDPADLTERWRAVPLQLFRPSGLALGGGFLAVSGRRQGQTLAILIDAANGKIVGDVQPKGVSEVSAALRDGLLILGTDRGIHAFGRADPERLEQALAALQARADAGDRSALPALANALCQRGDEGRAIALLSAALADERLPDADYATLKDRLNSLRESLASRCPAVLPAARLAVPPNIDGAIDEPWPAESAAHLDGPACIDEVQGIPIAEARWRSPSDLSAVLYTAWDSRNFYFAVDVSDDIHRTYTSQNETWVGDGLVISVDSENDGGYGYRFTSKDLLLTLALTRKDERRDEDEGEEPSGEYRVRLKDDNSGCVYEVAVPWDYLGIPDPKPGLRFGFNITVVDDDADRAVKAISWTPGMTIDRDRSLMIRGFTPAYFGDVLLLGPAGGPPPLWPPTTSPRDEQIRVRRISPPKER